MMHGNALEDLKGFEYIMMLIPKGKCSVSSLTFCFLPVITDLCKFGLNWFWFENIRILNVLMCVPFSKSQGIVNIFTGMTVIVKFIVRNYDLLLILLTVLLKTVKLFLRLHLLVHSIGKSMKKTYHLIEDWGLGVKIIKWQWNGRN